jgi:primosomal protein N' (replication factor Y)
MVVDHTRLIVALWPFMSYCQVIAPRNIDKPLTYSYNQKQEDQASIQAGSFVKIPLRGSDTYGVITSAAMMEHDAQFSIKPISCHLAQIPPLDITFIKFLEHMAKHNFAPIGMLYKMVMGDGKWLEAKKYRQISAQTPLPYPYQLNDQQQKAYRQIPTNGFSTTLLHGITGSGKTEVFCRYIHDIITKNNEDGKQALILLPEIALTSQFIGRFTKLFGFEPVVWHSQQTPAQRRDYRHAIMNNEARLVLGARSALTLPFRNLGVVVVDECHDSSYKQQDGVFYNAVDMAILRCFYQQIPCIISSATPTIEQYYQAKHIGKFQYLKLDSRYGGASLPHIDVVNRKQYPSSKTVITDPLQRAIKTNLGQRKQTLLFLNRRGYAPAVVCNDCGEPVNCSHCSAPMTYHKSSNIYKCHYCNNESAYHEDCRACGSDQGLKPKGVGVEKLAQEVEKLYPNARTIIFSSDHASTNNKTKAIVDKITNQEVDIIIATQMATKGYHFPNLTLVGVINADEGLIGVDWRSGERLWQTLTQVIGRAGRGEHKGKVILQTYQPHHPIFTSLRSHNQDMFYQAVINERKQFAWPPFSKVALMNIRCKNELKLIDFINHIATNDVRIQNNNGVEIMGPAPAPIYQLAGYYHYRYLLKADNHQALATIIKQWLSRQTIPPHIDVRLDVDPISVR